MAEEQGEEESEAPKGPSLVMVLILVVVLTVVAGGAGGGLGLFLAPTMSPAKEVAEKKDGEKKDEKAPEYSTGQTLQTLAPIVTNLAKPSHVFIRLESSVIFSKAPETDPTELTAKLTNDFLNFLRTLTIGRIEGPSGILHLKTDLNEIARVRSDGQIQEVIISSLVVE